MTATVPGRCPPAGNGSHAICFPAGDGLARNRICRPRFLGFDAGREAPSRSAPTIDIALPCQVRRYPADTDTAQRRRGRGRLDPPQPNAAGTAASARHVAPVFGPQQFFDIVPRAAGRDDGEAAAHSGNRRDDGQLPRAFGRGVSPRRPKKEALSLSPPALPRAARGRADRSPGNPARCPRRRAASAVRRRGRDRGRATI